MLTAYQSRRVDLELNNIRFHISRNLIYNIKVTTYVIPRDFLTNAEFIDVLKAIKKELGDEGFMCERIPFTNNDVYIMAVKKGN